MPQMPPPGEKPALAIAIGVPKPKGGQNGEPGGNEPQGKKHSEAEAHVVRADDGKTCANCANYQGESGDCSEVEGSFSPDDRCLTYFEPMSGGHDEPDADEQGGMPDNDADDMDAGRQ